MVRFVPSSLRKVACVAVALAMHAPVDARAAGVVEVTSLMPVTLYGRTVRLETVVVRPSAAEGRLPLALIAHGKPKTSIEARELRPEWLLLLARDLARQGYVAAVVLRPGYGRSEGTWASARAPCGSAVELPLFDSIAMDLRAALNALVRLPYVDPTRMVVIGQSAGGGGVLALATDPPHGLKGVVNIAGGLRSTCSEDGLLAAMRSMGRRAKVPSLWLYASNDSFFPEAQIERMKHAYAGAGGPAKLILYGPVGKDGHGLMNNGRRFYLPELRQFLGSLDLPSLPPATAPWIVHEQRLTRSVTPAIARYLEAPGHKAMAVDPQRSRVSAAINGASAAEAMARALDDCARPGQPPCEILMVDDTVVAAPPPPPSAPAVASARDAPSPASPVQEATVEADLAAVQPGRPEDGAEARQARAVFRLARAALGGAEPHRLELVRVASAIGALRLADARRMLAPLPGQDPAVRVLDILSRVRGSSALTAGDVATLRAITADELPEARLLLAQILFLRGEPDVGLLMSLREEGEAVDEELASALMRAGPHRDPRRARELLEQLPERTPYGDYLLGFVLMARYASTAEGERAALLFRQAAARGSAIGIYALAELYRRGEIRPRRHSVYQFLATVAADKGHRPAQLAMGRLLLTGSAEAVADPRRAVDYLKRALRPDDPAGHVELARAYRGGLGTGRDPARAREHAVIASQLGDPEGRSVLAELDGGPP